MDRLLDVLTGLTPLPPTRFVGHEGYIDNESWLCLLDALRHNTEAVGVRLRGCEIGCAHASQLAEVMATNASLEVLELPDNNIRERGLQALVDTLRLSNCTLKSIDLSGNPCCEDAPHSLQELDGLLKRNRVIKKMPKTPACGSGLMVAVQGQSGNSTPQVMPTSQISRTFLAKTGLTPIGLSLELEQRLQHLEEAEATIRSELEHVRSFSSQSEVWQKKIDAAGQQIAAILSLVDSRNLTLEARLQTMEHWRASAEQAWAGQSKVLEDMAIQLHSMMQRVHALEGQMESADAAGGRNSSTAPSRQSSGGLAQLRAATAGASPDGQTQISATLWQEVAALRDRLTKLEATPLEQAAPVANGSLRPPQGTEEQQQQPQQQPAPWEVASKDADMAARHEPGAAAGVNDGAAGGDAKLHDPHQAHQDAKPEREVIGDCVPCVPRAGQRAQLTLSASASEFSSLDNLSSAACTQDAGEDATGSVIPAASLSPSPLECTTNTGSSGGKGGSVGGGAYKTWQEQQRQSHPMRTSDSLQGKRGVGGVQSLHVPNSPILWHVNKYAVSPGSCGMTPILDAHSPAPMYACTKAKPAPAAATAGTSCPGSPRSPRSVDDSHDAADVQADVVDLQAEAGGCSGFVMYAAPQRLRDGEGRSTGGGAAQRYAPAQLDTRDSVDFFCTNTTRIGTPAADGEARGSVSGLDGDALHQPEPVPGFACTPGEGAVDPCSSPGTPRGSTFSVDAETVSLSVAMAGSAARPRAPAAASTTDTSPLAHASSTRDPDEPELDWAVGWPMGQKDKQQPVAADCTSEPGWAAMMASSSTGRVEGLIGSQMTEAGDVARLVALDATDMPAVSVRQWAEEAAAEAEAKVATTAVAQVDNLSPTPKPCPTLSPRPTAATAAAAARPGQQRLASPPPAGAAARRSAAVRASRPTSDLRRSPTEVKVAAPGAVSLHAWGEGHGAPSRPPTASQHHQQAAAAPARSSTSSTAAGRELVLQHVAEDAGAITTIASGGTALKGNLQGNSYGNSHAQSTRGGAASGGPTPHQAGPHAAAAATGAAAGHASGGWAPGRASAQGHSVRSLASRGDSGVGGSAATKPAGVAAVGRTSAKPGSGGLHRPGSGTNAAAGGSSCVSAAATGPTATRGSCFGATASTQDHPLRHAPGHRLRKTEGGVSVDPGPSPTCSATPTAPSSSPPPPPSPPPKNENSQGSHGAPFAAVNSHAVTGSAQLKVDLVARTALHNSDGCPASAIGCGSGVGSGGGGGAAASWAPDGRTQLREAGKAHPTCSLDIGDGLAAHAQGTADGLWAVHPQPQYSSRGYRPVGASSRTLAPGTSANVTCPQAKGGTVRASTRNVTSVAGATKRWM